MRSRVFHIAAAIISVLSVAVLSAAPVQAGPIHFADVVQIINGSKNGGQNVSLQLRNGSQSGRVQAASQAGPQSPAGTSSTGSASTASLISTIAAPQQGGASGLESIDQGDIEGTICDCGELALAGGGFPLWPLLGLAAIPLPFINRDETPESSPTPTPIPTPTPEPIPEPASLLLFGSGLAALGAGVRRRYMKTRVAERAATEEEV